MINEENILRSFIRKAIKHVKHKKENEALLEEQELRNLIKKMILQEKEREPAYDDTGLNILNSLFLDTGILKRIRIGYKELKSTSEQRETYKEHLIYHIMNLLNIERAKDHPGDQSEIVTDLQEQDELTLKLDTDGSELMGQEPRKETPEEKEDKEIEDFRIPGKEYGDTTGIKQAFAVFNQTEVKQSIMNYWNRLGNEEDKDTFYDNLLEQLKMYFDVWEEEVQAEVSASNEEDLGGINEPEMEDELEIEPEEELIPGDI